MPTKHENKKLNELVTISCTSLKGTEEEKCYTLRLGLNYALRVFSASYKIYIVRIYFW